MGTVCLTCLLGLSVPAKPELKEIICAAARRIGFSSKAELPIARNGREMPRDCSAEGRGGLRARLWVGCSGLGGRVSPISVFLPRERLPPESEAQMLTQDAQRRSSLGSSSSTVPSPSWAQQDGREGERTGSGYWCQELLHSPSPLLGCRSARPPLAQCASNRPGAVDRSPSSPAQPPPLP